MKTYKITGMGITWIGTDSKTMLWIAERIIYKGGVPKIRVFYPEHEMEKSA